jgi:hypothetical protein
VKKTGILVATAALGLIAVTGSAQAHHSLSGQYDFNKPVELRGVLEKMEYITPHSMVRLRVTNADGTITTWMFQTQAAVMLRRSGLARSGPGSLKEGDVYTVRGFAARNGAPMGFMRSMTFPDGREVSLWNGDPNG